MILEVNIVSRNIFTKYFGSFTTISGVTIVWRSFALKQTSRSSDSIKIVSFWKLKVTVIVLLSITVILSHLSTSQIGKNGGTTWRSELTQFNRSTYNKRISTWRNQRFQRGPICHRKSCICVRTLHHFLFQQFGDESQPKNHQWPGRP